MVIETHRDAAATAAMERLTTPAGVTRSWQRSGRGRPLVLVHGSFADHRSNWQFVADALARHATVHAVARRGRGETDATEGHSIEDEAADVAALLDRIEAPAVLLGHSHGAHVALNAARAAPERIARLVLYEPPATQIVSESVRARLEDCAAAGDWDRFVARFMREVLSLSPQELEGIRGTSLWPQFIADAPATLHDIRAVARHAFDARRFAGLGAPVTLQVGSESVRAHYVTDALLAALPDAREQPLPGQGHDAVFFDPDLFLRKVLEILEDSARPRVAAGDTARASRA